MTNLQHAQEKARKEIKSLYDLQSYPTIDNMLDYIDTLVDHIYQQAVEGRDATILGWREHDWPHDFDRKTAQLIADNYEKRHLTPKHRD